MSKILKNRCTVLLKQGGEIIGTFRPTQKIFHLLQKQLEPHRTIYDKKCFITLKQENVLMGNYKVDEKMFSKIKEKIEPFRSYGIPPKKVKCIETGQIFESTRDASHWLEFIREINYCNMDLIKRACRKKGTCFGYHWEFVEE